MPPSGLTFNNANTQYTLLASNLSANTQNFFWSWNFIVEPDDNQVAILHAEVDYRFLTGQIAILLEQGTAQVTLLLFLYLPRRDTAALKQLQAETAMQEFHFMI